MSLLTIIQDAADRLGIVRPSAIIGSADLQIRQLLSLSNQEGRELARAHNWQAITFEKSITATATETQTGGIPTDFGRFVDETFYNRTNLRPVQGPMTPQEWADYKGRSQTQIYDAFRMRGNDLLIAPTPTAGDSYVYEYVSKFWCTTAAGTTATLSSWAADDNIALLDEELIANGVSWRFLRAKGLDYSEAFRTYEVHKMQAISRDGGKRRVNMAGGRSARMPTRPTWPDGNWSLT